MKSRGKAYYTNRVIITLLSILVLSKSDCPTGTTGFNCVACPTGCDTCTTNSSTCDVCSKGYYISSSTCIQCPTNCLQCDTPTYCINCIPGYDAVTNAAGQQQCQFQWWKWFLIIFGTLLILFLVGLLIYWIRQKWNQEENQEQQVEYEMKVETTQNQVRE